MSDKPSIDLETRARWQRWEMDSLGTLKQPLNRRQSDRDPLHQAALQKRKAKILSAAHEKGQAQGYQEGFKKGNQTGHAQGLETGQAAGHAKGLQLGHAEGYAAGLAQGQAEGAAQAQERAARLDTLIGACASAINGLEQEVGQTLISLSVRIAEQVLRTHIHDHPNHILDLVQEVMQSRPEQNVTLHLRLHPDDLDLVKSFLLQDPDLARYRLMADERITRGSCIVETAQGSVDATLETRWQRIVAALGQPTAKP